MHGEIVIQYIGSIGVQASMRSIDPRTRSKLAKASISRLCKAANIDRRIEEAPPQDINQMLDDEPNLSYSGTRVELSITPTHLNVIDRETQETIVQHETKNVSFASSGDSETVDFVAYVAKNEVVNEVEDRACYVFQCSAGSGKIVLDEIARGFELRTLQMKTQYNANTLSKKSPTLSQDSFNSNLSNVFHAADFDDSSIRNNNENNHHNERLVLETRAILEKEPWFHGSYLTREETETRLKQDGDFLVRESMLDVGNFVLSVMNDGIKLHILFDTIGRSERVGTKEMKFDNISQLISYHHIHSTPIVAQGRTVYLKHGVRPTSKLNKQVL